MIVLAPFWDSRISFSRKIGASEKQRTATEKLKAKVRRATTKVRRATAVAIIV
jgi:hypothetical protein